MNVFAMLQRVEEVEEEESLLDELDESVNADGAMQPLQDKRSGRNVRGVYIDNTYDIHNK